ncbi:MAG: PLP-dependent transferase [Acidobacteria bacterium]|nr:MAG: PLP-dependent transferase [Acidobacteriota bacterium]
MAEESKDKSADLQACEVATQLVHAGERLPSPTGAPVVTPIYATATFTYDSMAEMDAVFADDRQGYVYTRHGNPTVRALESALQILEGGAGARAYASGMAALHAALFACELAPGATILAAQDLYGATTSLLHTIFGAFEIKIVTADFCDAEELRNKAHEARPRVLIAETISNPLLKVCDLDLCAEVAREVGARLIVDNTFASPFLCQPLRHGADLVVHSATKYLGGHGDATGGLVITRDAADMTALTGVMKLAGSILGVWDAHEILRGLKTLALRQERQCANARHLAERLAAHPHIARVHYPGLVGNDTRQAILRRMLRAPHAGALVSIELRENTRAAAFRFMDALGLCVRSTSLGDVFTSVLHPASASHRDLAPARRQQLGISDGLVRISVGIEAIADITNDIEQALVA